MSTLTRAEILADATSRDAWREMRRTATGLIEGFVITEGERTLRSSPREVDRLIRHFADGYETAALTVAPGSFAAVRAGVRLALAEVGLARY